MPERKKVQNRPEPIEIAAWVLMAISLVLVLRLHLLAALLSGLLVFELVHMLAPKLQRRVFGRRPRMLAVALLSALIVGLVSAAVVGIIAFMRSDAGSL